MKRAVMLLCLFLSASLLFSCKTNVVGMQKHASFNYQSVEQNEFAVAGVVSSFEQLENTTRVRLGDLLLRAFLDERPGLRMLRSGHLLKRMGSQSYAQLMNDYRITGFIGGEDVATLRTQFPDTKYLILARIEQDRVYSSHDESETDVADSEEDRKEGEFEHVRVEVSLTTTREMGVTLMVYDLAEHVQAWSGYVQKSETNSNHSSRTFNKDNRWREELVDAFVDALIGLDHGGYPMPPSQEEVLAEIFEGFAENMPEKE